MTIGSLVTGNPLKTLVSNFLKILAPGAASLPGGEGLGDDALERKLLFPKVVGAGVFDLELGHGVAERRLDLLLLAALELEGHGRVRDHLLDARNVRLKLLTRLEALAEGLIARLKFGRV